MVFGPGVTVEDGALIRSFSHLEGAHVGKGARVGPFARLRPGRRLGEDVHIGNFVEVKEAKIEAGAKANHLAYIGDARVGAGANIGAGTITCNYDGVAKHRTDIGKGAFIGSNSSLVAPVKIGDGAYVGSGSVVTKNVPADALAIGRAEQTIKPGWAKRLRAAQGLGQEEAENAHEISSSGRIRHCHMAKCVLISICLPLPVKADYNERGHPNGCAGSSEFSDASRSPAIWSMRSSASNIAAMTPPASPPWIMARWAPARRRQAARAGTRLAREPLAGNIGIGHTRWATHGKPTENNAHPHATDRVAVVHNGIIENFRELRDGSIKSGAKFSSETDTEVVAHLVTDEMKKGKPPAEAVAAALKQLRGAFALAFLFAGEDDLMIGARKGSPLAIGYGDGEMYLGSDAIALAPFTDTISYLEDGDWAVLTHKGVEIHDEQGRKVERRGGQVHRLRATGRQGQPQPLHGQGNP